MARGEREGPVSVLPSSVRFCFFFLSPHTVNIGERRGTGERVRKPTGLNSEERGDTGSTKQSWSGFGATSPDVKSP